MPICKLCLKEKPLMQSHILPEFMYAKLYDKNPRRFYGIKMTEETIMSNIEQKGIRERLLCKECESKLSKYEKYADENIYGKNEKGKARKVKQSVTEDQRVFLYEFIRLDYKKMKLFLDSLLWRILISSKMITPQYDPDVSEKLRLSLYTEIPLEPDEFPCLIKVIMKGPREPIKGFIMSPIQKTGEGRVLQSILIDGLEYHWYMTSTTLLAEEANCFLQKNGELKLFGGLIYDMPELVQQLSKGINHLKDRLKPN